MTGALANSGCNQQPLAVPEARDRGLSHHEDVR